MAHKHQMRLHAKLARGMSEHYGYKNMPKKKKGGKKKGY